MLSSNISNDDKIMVCMHSSGEPGSGGTDPRMMQRSVEVAGRRRQDKENAAALGWYCWGAQQRYIYMLARLLFD